MAFQVLTDGMKARLYANGMLMKSSTETGQKEELDSFKWYSEELSFPVIGTRTEGS